EKDLGTAQFLLGAQTWDSTPYHGAIHSLAHAATVPADTVPHWRDDLQTPELDMLASTPQTDLTSLYGDAQLGLYRLLGQSGHLDEAHAAAVGTLEQKRSSW